METEKKPQDSEEDEDELLAIHYSKLSKTINKQLESIQLELNSELKKMKEDMSNEKHRFEISLGDLNISANSKNPKRIIKGFLQDKTIKKYLADFSKSRVLNHLPSSQPEYT